MRGGGARKLESWARLREAVGYCQNQRGHCTAAPPPAPCEKTKSPFIHVARCAVLKRAWGPWVGAWPPKKSHQRSLCKVSPKFRARAPLLAVRSALTMLRVFFFFLPPSPHTPSC